MAQKLVSVGTVTLMFTVGLTETPLSVYFSVAVIVPGAVPVGRIVHEEEELWQPLTIEYGYEDGVKVHKYVPPVGLVVDVSGILAPTNALCVD